MEGLKSNRIRSQKETREANGRNKLCESNVYLRDEDGDKLAMEDAVMVERDGDSIKVTDILGEQKEFQGALEEITFLEHRIVIRV
jgi:predicted RNA-binding protein